MSPAVCRWLFGKQLLNARIYLSNTDGVFSWRLPIQAGEDKPLMSFFSCCLGILVLLFLRQVNYTTHWSSYLWSFFLETYWKETVHGRPLWNMALFDNLWAFLPSPDAKVSGILMSYQHQKFESSLYHLFPLLPVNPQVLCVVRCCFSRFLVSTPVTPGCMLFCWWFPFCAGGLRSLIGLQQRRPAKSQKNSCTCGKPWQASSRVTGKQWKFLVRVLFSMSYFFALVSMMGLQRDLMQLQTGLHLCELQSLEVLGQLKTFFLARDSIFTSAEVKESWLPFGSEQGQTLFETRVPNPVLFAPPPCCRFFVESGKKCGQWFARSQ